MTGFDSSQHLLQEYMDDLLRETQPAPQRVVESGYADDTDGESIAQTRARVARLLASRPLPVEAKPVERRPKTAVETPVASVAEAKVKTTVEAPVASATEAKLNTVIEAPPAVDELKPVATTAEDLYWMENGRPPWAQKQFDVLLFKVSGLTLAVPLIALGQIQPLTSALTPIFGQADWFMGLQPTAMGKVRTVNTARFVMPERYDENFVKTAKYVISIDGLPWGLAVDSVNQPITLDPEDVKWRTERSKRPWLAGTVKAHMCALIDIPMMGKLLVDADANARHVPKL